MAEVIWTVQALAQLDEIANHIALDKPAAAATTVRRVFAETDFLARFPGLGRALPTRSDQGYRMLWVSLCWIYYRVVGDERVLILHVRRAERPLRPADLDPA